MGQGGQVVLVNGTPYVWDLVGDRCSDMEWEFKRDASTVDPFKTRSAYVEVKRTLFAKTFGIATYQLRGTPHKFEIRADGFEVSAHFTGVETHNASWGSKHVLGRVSDRPCYFVLSGTQGDFSSIGDVQNWMQKKLPRLGQRSLRQICVTASHDSGMNKTPWITALAGPGSVITQLKTVEEQLKLGVRYFDVRPHLFEGNWVCGHYSYIDKLGSWQGGNGASLASIIEGINRFTQSSKELIVLNLHEVRSINNHFGKLEHGDFRDLTADEWKRLLNCLTDIRDLWTPTPSHGSPENINLTQLPLQDFIGGGRAAVVVIANPHPDLGVKVSDYKGCFRSSSWGWDSTPWDGSEGERLDKFREAKRNNPQTPYSYSGCHTQNDNEAILSSVHNIISGLAGVPLVEDPNSVVSLSKGMKEKVFRDLLPNCSKDIIPNAISFDAIEGSDMAALTMAFTDLAMS